MHVCGSGIFLLDFLINSFYFCALAFLEFALLNYGMQCAAWLKEHPRPPPGAAYAEKASTKVQPMAVEAASTAAGAAPGAAVEAWREDGNVKGAAPSHATPASRAAAKWAELTRRWMEACAKLQHLDPICRVLFPIAYLIFALLSFSDGLESYAACAETRC